MECTGRSFFLLSSLLFFLQSETPLHKELFAIIVVPHVTTTYVAVNYVSVCVLPIKVRIMKLTAAITSAMPPPPPPGRGDVLTVCFFFSFFLFFFFPLSVGARTVLGRTSVDASTCMPPGLCRFLAPPSQLGQL